MAQIHMSLDEVVGYFDELEEPRSSVNRQHPLVSVVVIAMMAVLAGAGGPTAIARWAALQGRLPLGSVVVAQRHSPQGRVPPGADVVAAGRFSSLLRGVVASRCVRRRPRPPA